MLGFERLFRPGDELAVGLPRVDDETGAMTFQIFKRHLAAAVGDLKPLEEADATE